MRMSGLRAVLMATMTLLALAGCALSPQQLTIQPVLPLDTDVWGRPVPLSVTAEDRREEPVLGSRGGVYGETSTLTIRNDLGMAIVRAANGYLATQRFQINATERDATRLRIVVEELSYSTPDSRIGQETRLVAVLRAEAERGDERLAGRYRSEAEYRTITRPNAEHNTRWVNQLLSDTLQRMFADPRLREFLRHEPEPGL